MPHLLYKPHVTGPKNDITTPDIVIDLAQLVDQSHSQPVPVHRLLMATEIQVADSRPQVTPAYSLVSAGGGTLIAPAILISRQGEPLHHADILISRKTWRLRNIDSHAAELELTLNLNGESSCTQLGSICYPQQTARDAQNFLQSPRSTVSICAAKGTTLNANPAAKIELCIDDKRLHRRLRFSVNTISVIDNNLKQRPLPRYSTGPVGEVKHFI